MTLEELEHAIRAACDITGDTEVYVFGSQSILGQIPDPPSALAMSAEADMCPRHRTDQTEMLNAIGEGSPFHRTHGFYVHGLPIEEAAVLPANWQMRTKPLRLSGNRGTGLCLEQMRTKPLRLSGNRGTGLCLEVHDLAASKLVAFREKDRAFVRVLLGARHLKARTLVARIRRLPIAPNVCDRLANWVHRTVQELD